MRLYRILAISLVVFGLLALIRLWVATPGTQNKWIQGPGDGVSIDAPTGATPSPTVTPAALTTSLPEIPVVNSVEASRQLKVLDEILVARNDNDPRMDSELRVLGEAAKEAFRLRYRTLPAEKRNERGTLVFLLGRNLTTPADYAFMREVLSEAPCLSMTDCRHPTAPSADGDEDHHGAGLRISLAYPQLTALKALQKAPKPSSPELSEAARQAYAAAKASPSDIVAEYAKKSAP